MNKRALFVCLDGCSPEYLHEGNCDNIKWMCREGAFEEGLSVVPTVTNVNNVSLITGEYPKRHRVISNCYYERSTGSEVYMESPDFIAAETIFEEAARHGLKTALVTAKEKLYTLLNKGVQVGFSAENSPSWITKEAGPPPNIYSLEVNHWIFKALRVLLLKYSPDLIYLATTDYAMHKFDAKHPEAKRQMELIDEGIGEILTNFNETSIYLTADHGMSRKKRAIDPEEILKRVGVGSKVIPTVKDRYVVHHRNLSGSAYIYLEDTTDLEKAYETLIETEGIEEILRGDEATDVYHLPRERIGELLINGKQEYVFGCFKDGCDVKEVDIRSHGSLHERSVPLIIYGAEPPQRKIVENKGLTSHILPQLVDFKRC